MFFPSLLIRALCRKKKKNTSAFTFYQHRLSLKADSPFNYVGPQLRTLLMCAILFSSCNSAPLSFPFLAGSIPCERARNFLSPLTFVGSRTHVALSLTATLPQTPSPHHTLCTHASGSSASCLLCRIIMHWVIMTLLI